MLKHIIHDSKIFFLRVMIRCFPKNKSLKIKYAFLSGEEGLLQDLFARKHGILESAYQRNIVKQPFLCREFIANRFKKSAKSYDYSVTKDSYGYNELQIIVRVSASIITNRSKKTRILDLGCGTGLVGRALKGIAEREGGGIEIDGVDLSCEMLQICKNSKIYSRLVQQDILGYMADNSLRYDLVVACSVIQFFSPIDLEKLTYAVRSILPNDGCFVFTFDLCENQDFSINEKLFGEHSVSLIHRIGLNHFPFVKQQTIMQSRIEKGKAVKGGIAIFSTSPISYF